MKGDMNNKIFGNKIRTLRKLKGLTQERLAELADIDEKHLSRIENGKYFPTYSTLSKLLKALGTTLEETGLSLENIPENKNPLYTKAIQIINAASNDYELSCYLESLKLTQKAINYNKTNM